MHRRPRLATVEVPDHPPLTWSDEEVAFPPVEVVAPADEMPTPMSWTPDGGFRVPEQSVADEPTGMRLVGQRGEFSDAISSTRDAGPVESSDEPSDVPTPTEPTVRYLPERGARRIEQPTSEVLRVVEHATGVHLGDVLIDRSPSVSIRATEMGAVAFTADDVVHLPGELGDQSEPANRAIVAHELTHVGQRRRLGSATPAESTPDGDALESQARSVQRSVWSGQPVVPAFLRSSASVPAAPPAGVQRLRDDEDPYEWQRRGPGPEYESAGGVLGSLFGVRFGEDSETGRDQHDAEEQWARDFEEDNADTLQQQRDDRYLRIYREARREAVIESRRLEQPVEPFDHDDILALRTRLDDEMPFEFGPPPGIDPYPGVLPSDDDETETEADGHEGHSAANPAGPGGAEARTTRRLPSTSSTPPAIGRAAAGGRRNSPARRRPGGGAGSEPDYDWQRRGPSSSDMLSSAFGSEIGDAIAGLFGNADDDEEERRTAEMSALEDELLPRRQRHERELRHRRIVQVRTEQIREGAPPEAPVTLVDDDITRIREQVDTDMPLEFAIPEYLPTDQDASFVDGNYGPMLDEPDGDQPTPDEPGSPDAATEAQPTEDDLPVDQPVTTGARARGAADADAEATRPATGPVDRTASDTPAGDDAQTGATPDTPDSDDEGEASRIVTELSETDMDALARRLYGRFRHRLRHELLIDRERAGALADMR